MQDGAPGEVRGEQTNLREADRTAFGTDTPNRCRPVAGSEKSGALNEHVLRDHAVQEARADLENQRQRILAAAQRTARTRAQRTPRGPAGGPLPDK
eukprot:1375612-Lingulodinium_polyedra.AAC.1